MIRRLSLLPLFFIGSLCTLNARLGTSLESYAAQRQKLEQQLASLTSGTALNTVPSGGALAAAAAHPALPQEKPVAESPEAHLTRFLELTAEHHGARAAATIAELMATSPEHMQVAVSLSKKHGPRLSTLLKDKEILHTFLQGSSSQPAPRKKIALATGTQNLLSAMGKLKKYFSVGEWGRMTRGLIGNMFRQTWHQIWRMVGRSIVLVMGTEKVYQVDKDGSIKRTTQGVKLPAMVPEVSINMNGEPEKKMVPNRWYDIVENEHGLLGQIAQSGIDKATKSALRSLDRLMFRPIVSRVLKVPFWKLSHTQYLLAMHERKYPNQSVLNPAFISKKIKENKDPSVIFTANMPYPLRTILQMKDPHKKELALQEAVTKHIWDTYKSAWEETIVFKNNDDISIVEEDGKTFVDSATGIVRLDHRPKKPKAVSPLHKQVGQELYNIGKDALWGKVQEGPLAQYYVYANMAASIPRMLFSSLGNGKEPPISGHEDKLAAIDLLEAVTRHIRDQRNETLSDDVGRKPIKIVIRSTKDADQDIGVVISPITQKRLIAAQEKLIGKYGSFLKGTFSGDSYESYIKRLLFPRIMYEYMPKQLKEKLKIKSIADTAKHIKTIEKRFNQSYNLVQVLNNLLAMIKRFENYETFAGHYVEIADTIDRFMLTVSRTMGAFDVKQDDWGKRFKAIMRKTYGKHVSVPYLKPRFEKWKDSWPFSAMLLEGEKVFTATQRQRIQRAMSKAGIHDLGVLLLDNGDAIKQYIEHDLDRSDEEDDKVKHTMLPNTFGKQANETEAEGKERLNRAQKVQEGRHSSVKLTALKITSPLTISSLKSFINDDEFLNKPAHERAKIARRATDIIVNTLFLLAARKGQEEDVFFTDGNMETEKAVGKTIRKLNQQMSDRVLNSLGHVRAAIDLMSNLFNEYGLREILAAFDDHYQATGEKMTSLPLALMGRIALREGMAHAVGTGAQFLLGKAMAPVLNQVARLQGNAIFGGPTVQGMLTGKINEFVGGSGRYGNAYIAGRSLARNIFNYGAKTALRPTNLMMTVGNQFMPGMMGPGGPQQELIAHAKMAAESGQAPPATVMGKMRRAGINTDRFSNPSAAVAPEMANDPLSALSPAAQKVLITAHQMSRENQQSAMAYLQQNASKLSESDQAIISGMMG